MNVTVFEKLTTALATERLDAYRQDGADEITTLGRYLLNMALCESLYSPLQFSEIAMRNAMHAHPLFHFEILMLMRKLVRIDCINVDLARMSPVRRC